MDEFLCDGEEAGATAELPEGMAVILSADIVESTALAERLGLSADTVQTHRIHIMNKLGLHNRAQLVSYVVKLGLLADSDGTSV